MMETSMDAQNHDSIIESMPVGSISQGYLFLARCFSYPDEGFYKAIKDNMLNEEIRCLVEEWPFLVNFAGMASPSLHQDEFESEYISSFDIGLGSSPPCPLYENFYRIGELTRRDILEEILLFYEHFDIALSEDEKDYPDHLVAELEFMAFLSQKEADSISCGKDPAPFRLVQSDFLERRLNKWAYRLDKRIQERIREPFYKSASGFMVEFISNHLLYLKTFEKNSIS